MCVCVCVCQKGRWREDCKSLLSPCLVIIKNLKYVSLSKPPEFAFARFETCLEVAYICTGCYAKTNLTKISDRQGPQTRLLKIYQPLRDVLDDMSNLELLDIIHYTCRSVTCDKLAGRAGESMHSQTGRSDVLKLVIKVLNTVLFSQ